MVHPEQRVLRGIWNARHIGVVADQRVDSAVRIEIEQTAKAALTTGADVDRFTEGRVIELARIVPIDPLPGVQGLDDTIFLGKTVGWDNQRDVAPHRLLGSETENPLGGGIQEG